MNGYLITVVYFLFLIFCAGIGIYAGHFMQKKIKSSKSIFFKTIGALIGVVLIFPFLLQLL
tara:strand:+ start:2512 stop:2694 length:183 start_codon:yes stop_codon:yes gene_type:complete